MNVQEHVFHSVSVSDTAPSKQACLGCRGMKVRCDRGSDTATKCARCVRLNIECVTTSRRRGRRPHQSQPTTQSPVGSTSAGDSVFQLATTDHDEGASEISDTDMEIPSTAKETITSPKDDFLRPPVSSPFVLYHTPVRRNVVLREDPVSRGLMSKPDAISLFYLYFVKINPLVAVLDPILCTLDYVQTRAPMLCTAVITVTAKFERRDVYPACLDLYHEHFSHVMRNGTTSVHIIQAILLMLFFRDPGDTVSYAQVGYAIRIAYELDLDKSQIERRPLPLDETEAREILSGERTWYELVSFDEVVSRQYDKPGMILPESVQDPHLWISAIEPFRLDIDFFIAAKADLRGMINSGWREMFPRDGKPPTQAVYSLRGAHIRAGYCRLKRWISVWIANVRYPIPETSVTLLHHYQHMCQFHLSVLYYRHVENHPSTASELDRRELAFVSAYGSAITLLDQLVNHFNDSDRLRYAQDYVWLGSAFVSMWLFENLPRMDESMFGAVRHCFERSAWIFRSIAKDANEPAAYHARFFDHLLAKISERSQGQYAPTQASSATLFGSSSNATPAQPVLDLPLPETVILEGSTSQNAFSQRMSFPVPDLSAPLNLASLNLPQYPTFEWDMSEFFGFQQPRVISDGHETNAQRNRAYED